MTNTKRAPLPQSSAMTLRDIYYVVFRHKKKIAIFFCCVLALVVLIVVHMPRIYESDAKMLIRLGRENAALDPNTSSGTPFINITESRETEINSDIEVLRSREIIEQIVDSLGVDYVLNVSAGVKKKLPATHKDSFVSKELAVQSILNNLTVELVKKTNIIAISFQSRSPQASHDILDLLILLFHEKHMLIYRPAGSYAFIEQQKNALEEQLKVEEQQLRDMCNSTGIVSVPEQQASLLARLDELKNTLEHSQADVAASGGKVTALENNIHDVPRMMTANKTNSAPLTSGNELHVKLDAMRVKRLELSAVYSDSSRRIKDLDKQINQIKSLLDSEDVKSNASTAIRQMQLDLLSEKTNLASESARVHGLSTMLQSTRNEMTNFNKNRIVISEMQRQLDIDEANYRKYVDNLEQARIDLSLKDASLSNISIIQPATYAYKSIVGSRKIRVVLFGLLFAFFGSLCVAFVREFFDHTIKRVEDIEEYLHLPGLGGIPYYVKDSDQFRVSLPNLHLFDTIREKLILAGKDGKIPQVLAVTSCYDGEGTGAIASNIAKSLITRPESGKVLLVDMDINNPYLHKAFSLPTFPGFFELLSSVHSNDITPLPVTSISGLEVLPAGNAQHKTLYLGKSERFSNLMSQWKSRYDYIVFSMPSISRSSLIMELANKVDEVILVVEAERIRREVIARLLSDLLHSGITVFGAVLNKQHYYVPQWLYKRL